MFPWELCEHNDLQIFQPIVLPGNNPGEITVFFGRACRTCGKCDIAHSAPPKTEPVQDVPPRLFVPNKRGRA